MWSIGLEKLVVIDCLPFQQYSTKKPESSDVFPSSNTHWKPSIVTAYAANWKPNTLCASFVKSYSTNLRHDQLLRHTQQIASKEQQCWRKLFNYNQDLEQCRKRKGMDVEVWNWNMFGGWLSLRCEAIWKNGVQTASLETIRKQGIILCTWIQIS